MATSTFGTNASTSLVGLQFSASMLDTDVGTIAQDIFDDLLGLSAAGKPTRNIPSAPFNRQGQLWIPNRGWLRVLPGDWVAVDTNSGWPILVSGVAVPLSGTPWAHNP